MRTLSGQAKYWPLTMGKPTIGWQPNFGRSDARVQFIFLAPLLPVLVDDFCTKIWVGHNLAGQTAASNQTCPWQSTPWLPFLSFIIQPTFFVAN